MKRHHFLIIIAAVLFGIAGAFVYRQMGDSTSSALNGSGSDVNVAAIMAAEMPDLAGKKQSVGQWFGKVMVVNFWAPWCPPCREEMPGFVDLQKKYGDKGLVFIGIALDEPFPVQSFVDEIGVNYPVLIGGPEAGNLSTAAGNRLGGLPYTVVIDREGKAVGSFTGAVAEQKLEALIKPLL